MKHVKEMRLTDAETIRFRRRLADETIPNGDCVEFVGGVNLNGYRSTSITAKRKHVYAHRAAYAIANGGFVPAGKIVMHSCDNRTCVNPDHLSLGTGKDNMDDMTAKGRRARTHGEGAYARVRALRAGGASYPRIAALTGVSTSQAYRIVQKG